MELTPTEPDSGLFSSMDTSHSVYGSTPKESTPRFTSGYRKRKMFQHDSSTNVLEMSPPFSSTLNEQFKQCSLDAEYYEPDRMQQPNKVFRESLFKTKKIHSLPCTPEKQPARGCDDFVFRPTGGYINKRYPEESPLKEARSILYPNLKPLEPPRKIHSPLKLKDPAEKLRTPIKKCLFVSRCGLGDIISNAVIMHNIFSRVSDGDVYRMSMVSKQFREAIFNDMRAHFRLVDFKEKHRRNKENYRITPPSSPEKSEQNPPSPNSRNFRSFSDRGHTLARDQSLRKCFACSKPAVVQNHVAQCESRNCGYIQCLRCNSGAYRSEDFFDKCNSVRLGGSRSSQRLSTTLEDLSNSPMMNNSLSFLSNGSSHASWGESGFCSDFDQTPSVKRNLSRSFYGSEEKKVLSINNHRQQPVQKSRSLDLPVNPIAKVIPIAVESSKRIVEDPPSPQPVKSYAAGSRQSKKNLRRLR